MISVTTTETGRSARKRKAILDAARTVFLRNGYSGSSMDEISDLAGVSKQTVYAHFSDKQRLFTEIVSGDIAPIQQPRAQELAENMPDTEDLASDLREFARHHLAQVMQPHLLRMRRVLIGEGERFPDLAKAWYDNGPERSTDLFEGWFAALDRRGLLRAPDPRLAAQHFNWLVLSIPLNKAMAYPIDEAAFAADELDHYADEGVRVFLAAYGT